MVDQGSRVSEFQSSRVQEFQSSRVQGSKVRSLHKAQVIGVRFRAAVPGLAQVRNDRPFTTRGREAGRAAGAFVRDGRDLVEHRASIVDEPHANEAREIPV